MYLDRGKIVGGSHLTVFDFSCNDLTPDVVNGMFHWKRVHQCMFTTITFIELLWPRFTGGKILARRQCMTDNWPNCCENGNSLIVEIDC